MAILVGAAALPVVREVVTSTVLANAHSGALKTGASLVGRAGWMRDGLHALRGRRAQFIDRAEIKSLVSVLGIALFFIVSLASINLPYHGLMPLQHYDCVLIGFGNWAFGFGRALCGARWWSPNWWHR